MQISSSETQVKVSRLSHQITEARYPFLFHTHDLWAKQAILFLVLYQMDGPVGRKLLGWYQTFNDNIHCDTDA